MKKTKNQFLEDCKIKRPYDYQDYEWIGDYFGSKFKMIYKHVPCGCTYSMSPDSFLFYNGRCPYCNRKLLNHQLFLEDCKKFRSEDYQEYEWLDEYKHSKCKIRYRHLLCGNVHSIRPSAFIAGQGCPFCKESRGEKVIKEFLIANNIKFQTQKKFDSCKDIRLLPFDFYFPDYNLCIEYDGEQHFKPKSCWGGIDSLREIQRRDEIKNSFCNESNNPNLLRISYVDFNKISDILGKVL